MNISTICSEKAVGYEARTRAERLRGELRRYEHLHYAFDRPGGGDSEYDRLMCVLHTLETSYPRLITLDSPTQRAGGSPREGFVKVPHSSPMLSLDNALTEEELQKFDRLVHKHLGEEPFRYVAELKMDGLSIAAYYEHGNLTRAVTRGDGTAGDDVTGNARTVRSLPLHVTDSFPRFEVRGETVMNRAAFELLNSSREERGLSHFSNPCSAAAGSLRVLEPSITASRRLEFYPYCLLVDGQAAFDSQWESLEWLSAHRFKTNPRRQLCNSIDEVLAFCRYWARSRETLAHEIDGVVIKIDSMDQQARLGFSPNAPRWAAAFKYATRQAATEVQSISVRVGRTGTLTPVAHILPVTIGGATVSWVTLRSESEIERLGIKAGDAVVVERNRYSTPRVVRVKVQGSYRREFRMPSECPVCGGKVVCEPGERASRCINSNCAARPKNKPLKIFATRSLAGMVFCLAGKFSMSRREFASLIANAGGKVSRTVNRETHYLVAGGEGGRKLANARELNVRVIDEPTFVKMVERRAIKVRDRPREGADPAD